MAEVTTETAETKTEAATSQTATETAATTLINAAESTTEQTSGTETQATETKTEAATTEAKTETKTEEKKPEGAPEKYEFKDADKFDPTVLTSFSEAAKEANLPQDAAQKVLDKVAPVLAERRAAAETAVVNGWIESAKTDKEFGGDKIKENMATALKAVDALYPDAKAPETIAFRELLQSPLGNHPDLIRLLFRAGKAISEDKFVIGGRGSASAPDKLNVLYDKTPAGKE